MVILIGELMKQAERYIADGLHPRIIAEVRMCPQPAQPQQGLRCRREGTVASPTGAAFPAGLGCQGATPPPDRQGCHCSGSCG